MDYQLVVLKGRSDAKALKLSNGITVLGRQQDCQLRIVSSDVSRKHCQLFEQAGKLVVVDLGSSNGTFVNGKKISGQQALNPGDILSLGKVKFRVEKGGTKPADTAVAEAALLDDDSGDEVEFEIDFDEDESSTAIADEGTAEAQAVAPAAAPAPEAAKKAPEPDKAPEIGEEAVADFLLGIDLDDEDKR